MEITSGISTSYTSSYAVCRQAEGAGSNSCGAIGEQAGTTGKNSSADKENQLSDEEKQRVQELQTRDREVRAHEMAHVAAGGQYVRGGASFEYQTGPDGKRYAVGGEVSIDTSEVKGNPQATIVKMQVVKSAAMAPAQPSGQDRAVAAQASAKEMKARVELREQQTGGSKAEDDSKPKTASYSRHGIAVPKNADSNPPVFTAVA